ncbi:MAG TPA: hypothetical protein VK172_10515 [Lentimicrobium sp.]|nr:hypothetical protein [Lentimicrobium sp.]
MEKIEVNQKLHEQEVQNEADRCIKQIRENAQRGIKTTDLYYPKYLGYDVKEEVDRRLTESKTPFSWQIVKTGSNQYTGRTEHFTGETVGDEKHCRVYIY